MTDFDLTEALESLGKWRESSDLPSEELNAWHDHVVTSIDHYLEKKADLVVEYNNKKCIKKYQFEVLLNAVRMNPSLENIHFEAIDLEEDCWEMIADFLAVNSRSKTLVLRFVLIGEEELGLFARSLKVSGAVLTCLVIEGPLYVDEEAAKLIKLIFELCPNLKEFATCNAISLGAGQIIGNAVGNHKALAKLKLSNEYSLHYFGLNVSGLLLALKVNISLKHLHINRAKIGGNLECLTHVASIVETLDLEDVELRGNPNREFFKSLENNTKLKFLDLSKSSGLENLGSVEDLINAMRVNTTLEEICLDHTDWSYGGKAALVQEALQQRLRQKDYLQVLRDTLPSVTMKVPTIGRVFLCGQPYAGKSQLAYTMMQVEGKKSFVTKYFAKKLFSKKRTKGIEIQVLKNDESKQIVLWDLAGQEIFRALQEHLFPKINKACLYLFVFNPRKYGHKSEILRREAMEEEFDEELNDWLRFICTNSNISRGRLPNVVVVITHNDLLIKLGLSTSWVKDRVVKVRKQFEGRVEILKTFVVDGRESKDIGPLLIHVYNYFDNVLVDGERVPHACHEVNRHVLNACIVKNQAKESFMSVKDFVYLCGQSSPIMAQKLRDEVVDAMGKYLHDVGTIIDISKEDLIVVNPNWLTKDFLGRMINDDHGFGTSENPLKESMDGIISDSQLKDIFGQIFGKGLKKRDVVEYYETLKRMMIGLNLCHKVGKDYFVPILFETSKFARPRVWKSKTSEDKFLGLRLCCANKDLTYLTTAVFSRFQVFMHKRSKEIFDQSLNFKNHLNCIWLHVNGYEVLIECDSLKGRHVDVLVRISRRHETVVEEAWRFAWVIVEEIRKFYASPEGAPGVALVCEIIRKECVERLTPCHLRGEKQAISILELKGSLEKSLENISDELLANSGLSSLHYHTWPSCNDANLKSGSVSALDLLHGCPDSDAQKVQRKAYTKFEMPEKKNVEFEEHEKTRRLIVQLLKNLSGNSSMPKLPYFTSHDVGMRHQITATVNIGVPMMLHFMCESSNLKHFVRDQKGFMITVDKENCELLRSIIQSSFKVIGILAKVATKTTIGLSGDIPFIPQFAEGETKLALVGGAVTIDKLLNEGKLPEFMVGESTASREAWHYMKEKVEPQLQGRYGELFGLYKIDYVESSSEATTAWLCKDCIDKGKATNVIMG